MKINKNFDNLVPNYLFAEVAKRTNEFIKNNPRRRYPAFSSSGS